MLCDNNIPGLSGLASALSTLPALAALISIDWAKSPHHHAANCSAQEHTGLLWRSQYSLCMHVVHANHLRPLYRLSRLSAPLPQTGA